MTKAPKYGAFQDALGFVSLRIRQENHDPVCSDYCDHKEIESPANLNMPSGMTGASLGSRDGGRSEFTQSWCVERLGASSSEHRPSDCPPLPASSQAETRGASLQSWASDARPSMSSRLLHQLAPSFFSKRHDEPDYSGAM